MKKNLTKFISIFLAVALIFSAAPIYADELSDAQQKKKELQSSLNAANALVKSLKDSKESTEEKIRSLDAQIASAQAQSEVFENEIDTVNAQMAELVARIEETKAGLDEKARDMKLRIIYSYENGRNNMINALFESKSMTDFLNVLQYTIDLAKYDQEAMDRYEQTLQVLSEQEDALSAKQKDAEELALKNEEQIRAVSVLKSAKEEELAGLDGEITDAKAVAEVYEKEVQAQNEVLAAIRAAIEAEKKRAAEEAARKKAEEERKRQEALAAAQAAAQAAAANGQSASGQGVAIESAPAEDSTPAFEVSNNVSGFTWPCPSSKRITSEFGERESPVAGASTNHKGIDIGAPTGSSIVAAQAGKVILSQYSASAGNYIIISHGMNAKGVVVCTVYMHADTRLVEVGDEVSRGQQIATVGSTGYSTGPHLHFGVSEDGTYVNPWGYL